MGRILRRSSSGVILSGCALIAERIFSIGFSGKIYEEDKEEDDDDDEEEEEEEEAEEVDEFDGEVELIVEEIFCESASIFFMSCFSISRCAFQIVSHVGIR